MARWDKIVEYFYRLEKESDKIKVIEMGKSTEGHPFLVTIISSPDNLANLERLREINGKIADPRGLSEDAVKALISEGKSVVCQSMSLHASEIGGTQMAPELAYDLLAIDTPENALILQNVVFLMVPCFNPDGQVMVTDWYNRWVGTEYEGTMLPWLYHKYAGHDNNRDAFALNLVESQYMAKLLFTDWHPQAFQDHHHMGSTGARLFLAPYSDAIRPFADPLVWREDSWFGAHMAYTLEEQGKTGILNGAQFPGWGHFGFHWIATHHNIAGMLTESASAKLATPLYIHPHQLRGASPKNMPTYEAQTNFPHPWPGGWWRLRDIVEQQKISAWALLDICAKFKDKVLWNAYLKAKRQTERGACGDVKAYVIQPGQHDPLTVKKLVGLILSQGVEVRKAGQSFVAGGRLYEAGSYIVFLDQPKMGVIRNLLGRTFYPDNYWTRNPDGSPIMYDTATDTIAEFMGVKVEPVTEAFGGEFPVIGQDDLKLCLCEGGSHPQTTGGEASGAGGIAEKDLASGQAVGYLLDPRLNDSYTAVNRLLKTGAKVWRYSGEVSTGDGGLTLPPGAFYVASDKSAEALLRETAVELGLAFFGVTEAPDLPRTALANLRVGMYQRYYGGNADEGWARLVLEKFEFPYATLMDADVKRGNLIDRYDVIVLPSDRPQAIVGMEAAPREVRTRQRPVPPMPPEYRSGLGKEGTKALQEFVKAGGRLVALDGSSDFVIEALDLKVRNVVANASFKDFYCHGSTLHAKVDNSDPLGYGMPAEALVLNMDSPTFDVTEMFLTDAYRVVAEYPGKGLLQSGWLIGEERIAGKPCMIAVSCGDGEVVLVGFRPQFRAQTHGTFKLLFNCLF